MSDLTTVEMVEQLRLSVIGSDNGAAFDHAVADRLTELEAEVERQKHLVRLERTAMQRIMTTP